MSRTISKFVITVDDMVKAQERFFKSKQDGSSRYEIQEYLKEAKRLEKEVKTMLPPMLQIYGGDR